MRRSDDGGDLGRRKVPRAGGAGFIGLYGPRGRKIAGTVSRFTARSLLLLARFISTYDEDTSTTTVVSTSGACATIHATPTSEAKPQSLSECFRTYGCNRRNCSGRERYIHTYLVLPASFFFFFFFLAWSSSAIQRRLYAANTPCVVANAWSWAVANGQSGKPIQESANADGLTTARAKRAPSFNVAVWAQEHEQPTISRAGATMFSSIQP